MMGLKEILKKLFSKGYITNEEVEKNGYDLLTEILNKRKIRKKKIDELDKINLELQVFFSIISDEDVKKVYSKEQLETIYNNIISKSEGITNLYF